MLKQHKCGKTKPVSFLTSQHFFTLLLVEVYMLVIIKIGYQIFLFLSEYTAIVQRKHREYAAKTE
jgi:hypothetical protein